MEDAHDPKFVQVGFKDYWNKTKLKEHYASLKKNPDGSIKVTHKGIWLKIHFLVSSHKHLDFGLISPQRETLLTIMHDYKEAVF